DGARALSDLVPPEIHAESAKHSHDIDPGMDPEAPILGGEHGVDHGPRDLLDGDPALGAVGRIDDADGLVARKEMDGGLAAAGVGKREMPGGAGYGDDDNRADDGRGDEPSTLPPCLDEGSHSRPLGARSVPVRLGDAV